MICLKAFQFSFVFVVYVCVCMYLSDLHILWKLGFLSIGVGTVLYFIYFQILYVAFSDTDKNSIFKIWFPGVKSIGYTNGCRTRKGIEF